MCDFRGPPTGIRNLETGEVRQAICRGTVNGTSYTPETLKEWNMSTCLQPSEVTEEGIYHVMATGGYYTYFDGKDFYKPGIDGDLYYKDYSLDPFEYHYEYELLFDPHLNCDCFGMIIEDIPRTGVRFHPWSGQ